MTTLDSRFSWLPGASYDATHGRRIIFPFIVRITVYFNILAKLSELGSYPALRADYLKSNSKRNHPFEHTRKTDDYFFGILLESNWSGIGIEWWNSYLSATWRHIRSGFSNSQQVVGHRRINYPFHKFWPDFVSKNNHHLNCNYFNRYKNVDIANSQVYRQGFSDATCSSTLSIDMDGFCQH